MVIFLGRNLQIGIVGELMKSAACPPWQIIGNESVDNSTDAGAREKEEKGPTSTHLGDYEWDRPEKKIR